MQISTATLKAMLAKSAKAVGNNKLLPLTSLINIELHSNELNITTTNMNDYLTMSNQLDDKDDFSVTVNAEMFIKLISKITTEFVELEVNDNTLLVTGNGSYTIELPQDENGDNITLKSPLTTFNPVNVNDCVWSLSEIATLANNLKPALLEDASSEYSNYYIGEYCIATDAKLVNEYKEKLLNTPALLSVNTVDILNSVALGEVNVTDNVDDNVIVFKGSNFALLSHKADNISNYKSSAIHNLTKPVYESTCVLKKSEFLSALDRVSLFVSQYDGNAISIMFAKDCISIISKNSSGSEIVEYMQVENHKDYRCTIDINMLMTQLKAHSSDSVEIQYGDNRCLKLVDGKLTQLIALIA